MLVLSRHLMEQIVIGSNIKITVLAVKGDAVKIGVEAPRDVPVHRQEIFDRIQAENRRQRPAA